MKKLVTKSLSVFLAAVMLFTALPVTAFAASVGTTSITYISVTNQQVKLKWKKAKNAKKYQVQYSVNSKFKSAKTTSTNKTNKTVSSLSPSKTYYFRVRGINGKRRGKWSAKKKAKTKSIKVSKTDITSVGSTDSSLTVSWKKVSGVSGYQLKYTTDKSFKKNIVTTYSSGTSKELTRLKRNTMYYVRVRGYKKYLKKNYYAPWSKTVSKVTSNPVPAKPKFTTLIPDKLRVDQNGNYSLYFDKDYTGKDVYGNDFVIKAGWQDKLWEYKVTWTGADVPILVSLKNWGSSKEYNEYCKNLYEIYKHLDMPDNATDIEKLMIISRYIDENYSYAFEEDRKTPDVNCGYATDLVKYNKTVCHGFASFTRDICYLYSVPCFYVVGKLNAKATELHAWNIVKLNNYWYQIDFTRPGKGVFNPNFEDELLPYKRNRDEVKYFLAVKKAQELYGDNATYQQIQEIKSQTKVTDTMVDEYNNDPANNGMNYCFEGIFFFDWDDKFTTDLERKVWDSNLPHGDINTATQYFQTMKNAYFVAKEHNFK